MKKLGLTLFFCFFFNMPSSLCYVCVSPSKSQIDYSRWLSSFIRSALYLLLLFSLFYCRLIGPRSAGCTSLQLRHLAPHPSFLLFCQPFDFLLLTLRRFYHSRESDSDPGHNSVEGCKPHASDCRPAGLHNSVYCSRPQATLKNVATVLKIQVCSPCKRQLSVKPFRVHC